MRTRFLLGLGRLVCVGMPLLVGCASGSNNRPTTPSGGFFNMIGGHSPSQSTDPTASAETFRLASTRSSDDGSSDDRSSDEPASFSDDGQTLTSANQTQASQAQGSQAQASQTQGPEKTDAAPAEDPPEVIDTPQPEPADDGDGGEADSEDTADNDEPAMPPLPLQSATLGDQDGSGLPLQDVVASVQSFYPLLEVAFLERDRTAGDQLAAWGAFDTKVKGATENQPLGFYENYQHGGGLNQPLYRGGEVYGGYRIGRGIFEPWYLERETNKGGEFKTGFELPLLRNKEIDDRRADLWRATYARQLAEPNIRQEVIMTIRDATVAYWVWVAAGRQYDIGRAALELAQRRNQQIERRVQVGDLGQPELTDNERAIIQRQGKLIDLERKLIQSAVKLSLFLRGPDAAPVIPTREELPSFPEIVAYDTSMVPSDIAYAINRRPELVALDLQARTVQVDFAEARNDTLATLDVLSNVSQDVGERTSAKGDKSEFELEVGMVFEMPLQRRKGFGKMRSAQAKLRQIDAKRQFTIEKIATEVQAAAAALEAAYNRVERIAEAVEFAERLAQIERRKFELGESDLLSVFLREQIAIEAAIDLVVAELEYFVARADYTAALAYEFPVFFTPPEEAEEP